MNACGDCGKELPKGQTFHFCREGSGDALTANERQFLNHVHMWGSDGYPVRAVGPSKWLWDEFFGVKGAPVVYRTKRECVAAIERYIDVLIDKSAGRL